MISGMCKADDSVLLLVDVQTKLLAAMQESSRSTVLRTTTVLLKAANELELPVLVTEQYPKGLGPTEPEIGRLLPGNVVRFEKTEFSACAKDEFVAALESSSRGQIILVGLETHVCVLQTAFDLLRAGFCVFVVEDGVCSRSTEHKTNALIRMARGGVVVSNVESVLFEWLRSATNPSFKAVSALIR